MLGTGTSERSGQPFIPPLGLLPSNTEGAMLWRTLGPIMFNVRNAPKTQEAAKELVVAVIQPLWKSRLDVTKPLFSSVL